MLIFRYFLILANTLVYRLTPPRGEVVIKKSKFHGGIIPPSSGHETSLLDLIKKEDIRETFPNLNPRRGSWFQILADLNSFVMVGLKPFNRMSDI